MTQWNEQQLRDIAREQGTPCFVYSRDVLAERAHILLNLELPYGLINRYAVKANNHPEVIRLFHEAGLEFDASSGYEAQELLEQGVPGEKISLSSQQPAHNLTELLAQGVQYVATSLHQLELFLTAENHPSTVGPRVNPGIGAGHNNRTTTGGANSSFGLWQAYVPQALETVAAHGVSIDRLHIHLSLIHISEPTRPY